MTEIPVSAKDLGISSELQSPPENERESLRRTLAGAWVATVNKMSDVVEGVRSYVFNRDSVTQQEEEKALQDTDEELSPEELVFILRGEYSRRRSAGFVDRIKTYQEQLGVQDDESQSTAVAQDMQRAYMYLSEHGAKKLSQVYERNSKDEQASTVQYRGELQGVSLAAIKEVLAYNKDIQVQTLLSYGFDADTQIHADSLREQIAESKLRQALADKKIMMQQMQRHWGRALSRIGELATVSALALTILQSDTRAPTPTEPIQYEEQSGWVPPEAAVPTAAPVRETVVPATASTSSPPEAHSPAPVPTESPVATPEQAPKEYYRFGNIELGPADGTPGKPTFLFIESTKGNFVLFFRPKQVRVEDLENNAFDWKLPYNTSYIDGDANAGYGATLQTIHSGSSDPLFGDSLLWPAENLRQFIEEQGTAPEDQIAALEEAITRIAVVQVDGFIDGRQIDYADPKQVEELIQSVDINGANMVNPVIQESELISVERLNPMQTTALEEDYMKQGSLGKQATVVEHFTRDSKAALGELIVMYCGEVASGEQKDPNRPNNQQTRNFISLRPIP